MNKNYSTPDLTKEAFICPHYGTLSLMNYYTLCYRNVSVLQAQPGINPAGNSRL